MKADTTTRVLLYIQSKGPTSVERIKRTLRITERNAVEQVVLTGLNSGKLELTVKGIQVKN